MKKKDVIAHWKEEGGLITIKLAAEIIGIKQPSVSRAADSGKIKSFSIGKTRFLSFNEVMIYAAMREKKN